MTGTTSSHPSSPDQVVEIAEADQGPLASSECPAARLFLGEEDGEKKGDGRVSWEEVDAQSEASHAGSDDPCEEEEKTNLWKESLVSSAHAVQAWDDFAEKRGKRALTGCSHKHALETMLLRHGTSHKYRKQQWVEWSKDKQTERVNVRNVLELIGQRPLNLKSQEAYDQILMDVPRTCPEHEDFRNAKGSDAIERVLFAFALRHPDIGYLQSMNFLAALLYIVLQDEDDVYQVFSSVVVNMLPGYYADFSGLKRDTRLLKAFIERDYPDLHKHFADRSIGFDVAAAAPSWLLPLYFTVLSPRTIIRVWDLVLFYGKRAHSVMIKIALANMKAKRKSLLSARSLYDVYKVFKGNHCLPKAIQSKNAPDDGDAMLLCFARDVSQYGLLSAEALEKMDAEGARSSSSSKSKKRKSLSACDLVSPSKKAKTDFSESLPLSQSRSHRRAVSDSPMIISKLKDWMSPMKRRRPPSSASRSSRKQKRRLAQRFPANHKETNSWSLNRETPDKRRARTPLTRKRSFRDRVADENSVGANGNIASSSLAVASPPVTESNFAVEMKTLKNIA